MRKLLRFVLLSTSFLTGCISHQEYGINVKAVTVIDQSGLELVTGNYYNWMLPRTGGQYYRVEVSLNSDFIYYVFDNSVSISVAMYFCDHLDEQVFVGLHNVYALGKSLGGLAVYGPLTRADIQQDKPFDIDLILFPRWELDPKIDNDDGTDTRKISFDLMKHPRDICFTIQAAGMGFGVRSEMVTIPKEDLSPANPRKPK